jgi:hypothetical protein
MGLAGRCEEGPEGREGSDFSGPHRVSAEMECMFVVRVSLSVLDWAWVRRVGVRRGRGVGVGRVSSFSR